MKNLFLTLVALISFTNIFAQSADDDNLCSVYIEPEVKLANSYSADFSTPIESICDFSITDQNGNSIETGTDVEIGTKLKINFTKFYDQDDYRLLSISLNDKEVELNEGSYEFTVDNFTIVSVEIAKAFYEFANISSFVSLYDGTSDVDFYEFDGIYDGKVYGIPTKKIEAGKPYIALSGGCLLNYDLSKSAIKDFADKNYNGFYPSTSNFKSISGDDFMIFKGGTLSSLNTNGTKVTVGNAYFVASEAIKTGVPSADAKVIMTLENETNGIAGIFMDKTSNSPIFNISGQRISGPVRGLYVVNGKKVLKK